MWRYGNDFREAALALTDQHDVSRFMPYYFLIGQSIELSLKAFLLGRGESLRALRSRKFGHDLDALQTEARRRQLGREVPLTNVNRAVIQVLGIEYLTRRFQYARTGTMYLPLVALAQEAADKLSSGLESYCRSKSLR